jgi:hypothetical protein
MYITIRIKKFGAGCGPVEPKGGFAPAPSPSLQQFLKKYIF